MMEAQTDRIARPISISRVSIAVLMCNNNILQAVKAVTMHNIHLCRPISLLLDFTHY